MALRRWRQAAQCLMANMAVGRRQRGLEHVRTTVVLLGDKIQPAQASPLLSLSRFSLVTKTV